MFITNQLVLWNAYIFSFYVSIIQKNLLSWLVYFIKYIFWYIKFTTVLITVINPIFKSKLIFEKSF